MSDLSVPLRILAVSNQWQGANDYAFVRAFRRMGHSVRTVDPTAYTPLWRSRPMQILRRLLQRRILEEFNAAVLREARQHKPDLLFVFKGAMVMAETLRNLKQMGVICIQFYPDVSFRTHGAHLPKALPEYDWVFTTKSFGLADMSDQLGVMNSSFLAHGFDPETHAPSVSSTSDVSRYSCAVSFIGNISERKIAVLRHLANGISGVDLKIWGPDVWLVMPEFYQGQPVFGQEYAKAIQHSRINLGLLSEKRAGSSSGDLVTARSFEIPAAGGFMLHERTAEAESYFEDGKECAFFDDPDDLVAKVRYYLDNDKERHSIADAGRQRCLTSGYSIDCRAQTVIEKYHTLRSMTQAREEVQ